MRHRVLVPFRIRGELFEVGSTIEVSPESVAKLGNRIKPISNDDHPAWLENEELRTRGHVPDLSGEICRLTENDLPLQRTLLLKHCEEYDNHHFWRLKEEWEERAAIMQFDGNIPKKGAEIEAARCLHLLAFLDDLQGKEAKAA